MSIVEWSATQDWEFVGSTECTESITAWRWWPNVDAGQDKMWAIAVTESNKRTDMKLFTFSLCSFPPRMVVTTGCGGGAWRGKISLIGYRNPLQIPINAQSGAHS